MASWRGGCWTVRSMSLHSLPTAADRPPSLAAGLHLADHLHASGLYNAREKAPQVHAVMQ